MLIIHFSLFCSLISVNTAAKLSNNSKTNKGSDHQVPPNLKVFSYTELKTATQNFSANVQLGEGSSQMDFIGWIDEKSYEPSKVGIGMAVAIKKFNLEGFQEFIGWQVNSMWRHQCIWGLDACDGAYVAQHRWPEVLSTWYSKNTLYFSCKLAFILQQVFNLNMLKECD